LARYPWRVEKRVGIEACATALGEEMAAAQIMSSKNFLYFANEEFIRLLSDARLLKRVDVREEIVKVGSVSWKKLAMRGERVFYFELHIFAEERAIPAGFVADAKGNDEVVEVEMMPDTCRRKKE